MLEDIFLSPFYWAGFVVLMTVGALLMRARILDFKFIALGFISQYVVHSVMAFGAFSEIAVFCMLFWLIFVCALTPCIQSKTHKLTQAMLRKVPTLQRASGKLVEQDRAWRTLISSVEKWWVLFAKWFLLAYWACRLVFYPYIAGELDLTVRLEAGLENRVLFFLGLAVFPAIAACVAVWIRRGYKFRILDYAVLAIMTVGYLGTGSKVAILPIILIVFGAISFFKKPLREMRLWIILAGVGGVIIGIRYIFFFPSTGLVELAQQALYRFVANTDSVEYLLVNRTAPGEFPFAGPGALIPMFLKPFGFQYDYSPGVWLHGTRFDEWAGFGPNSGIVMDYFGNLGWAGLLIALAAAIYVIGWTRVGGAIGCSFIAITYQLFVDVTLFDIAFFFWLAVLIVMASLMIFANTPRGRRAFKLLEVRPWRRRPRAEEPESDLVRSAK